MKIDVLYYTELASEYLEEYYDEEKHGSWENFFNLIEESVKKTVDDYKKLGEDCATCDFDDDEFDSEIFGSDVLADAKRALKDYKNKIPPKPSGIN